MKSFTCNLVSTFTIWILVISGLDIIDRSKGAKFLEQPARNQREEAGTTLTWMWSIDDSEKNINNGDLSVNTGQGHHLLFRFTPQTNETARFRKDVYPRIHITSTISGANISLKLVLANITTADTGFYSLKVKELINDGTIRFNDLLSNVSLYVTEKPHSLHIYNGTGGTVGSNLTRKEGESLYVQCNISGAPTPEVTWYRGTNEVATGIGSALFHLDKINAEHGGSYVCKGKNSVGKVQSSLLVDVSYLHLNCSEPFNKNGKNIVRYNAIGKPDPECTRDNIKVTCQGEVELTKTNFNVSLNAKNDAGLMKSCRKIAEFNPRSTEQPASPTSPTSSTNQMSFSMISLVVIFLITMFVIPQSYDMN